MKEEETLHPQKPSPDLWFSEGLLFTCTGCGDCCTGAGRVWLTEEEIVRLANHLGLSPHQLVTDMVERVEGRWALREDPQSGACTFLRARRCEVYEARPRQCRTFPWWPSTLSSPEAWREAERTCEGINHPEARSVPLIQIQESLREEQEGRRGWRRKG